MFRRIRWELTAWYVVALAVTLLIIGVVLYQGERASLLNPIDSALRRTAAQVIPAWQGPPTVPCPRFFDRGVYWACYDQNGRLQLADRGAQGTPGVFPGFADPSLVQAALRNGSAIETITTHSPLSLATSLRLYAVRVSDPHGGQPLGVYEAGLPVGDRIQALQTLLSLLVITGVIGLVAAAIGGLFLARRSLQPAQVAYLRQRDFIADASHELRTPLTMLRSNVEVVLRGRGQLPADDVALLEDTVMEAGHLTALANNMLDLARLDRNGIHLEEDVVDLGEMTAELARWAEALAAQHQLTIRADSAETVLVVGDRTLLEQAVLTLIDNAIKYNRPGGAIEIRVWCDQQQAHLEVRDTGIGIEAAHVPHLGERFYRVDKARSRESGGAGLGLSIVRGIAAQHGGSLHLDSDPGSGTSAILSFPATHASRTSAR
jgi:signal transduction histidine kinase